MNTRRRWYIATGLVIVALILATDSFTILDGVFRRPIPVHPEATVKRTAAVISDTGAPAVEYLAARAADAELIFLGEFPQVAEHAAFLAESIPELAATGVRTIALEHLRSADQARIDAVTAWEPAASGPGGAADAFDTDAANMLLFRRDVTWGFREYRDILRAAWEHNRTAPDARVRIRGLAIGRGPDTTPEAHEIALERHMAERLAAIVEAAEDGADRQDTADPQDSAATGETILVYTSARRAVPDLPDAELRAAADVRRLAVWARTELDVAVRSILLHAPWPEQDARYGLNYPATGLLDSALFSDFGADPPLPWGFDVRDTALEGMTVDPLGLRPETESTTLGKVMDGYIVLSPLSDLTAATPIPDFVRADTEAEAVARYPGSIPDSASAEDINSYIARTSENLGKILDSFRNVD